MKVCERVVGWCAVWSKLCCPIIRRSIVLSGYVHGLRIDCVRLLWVVGWLANGFCYSCGRVAGRLVERDNSLWAV